MKKKCISEGKTVPAAAQVMQRKAPVSLISVIGASSDKACFYS